MAVLNGSAGGDAIIGTTLQDQINGYGGNDTLEGGDGDDTIYGTAGNDRLVGGAGNDLLDGGTSDDVIEDGDGNDTVNGSAGDDLIIAGQGDDIYVGGSGFDTLDLSGATHGVTVDLSKGTVSGLGTDSAQGFEAVIGTAYADNIKGSAGDDVILAGEGRNTIRGLAGSDELTGGGSRDTFVWKTKDVVDSAGNSLGVDKIMGFENNDALDIREMLKGQTYASVDDVVHLTDVAGGTLLQVKVGNAFADVALIDGLHTGGASAAAWAMDGIILV